MAATPARRLAANAELDRDPTRSVTLRRDYARAHSRRWRWLKGAIRRGVGYESDALGLSQDPPTRPAIQQESPEVRRELNRLRRELRAARRRGDFDRARRLAREFVETPGRFNFPRSSQKAAAFSGWLDQATDAGIIEVELDANGNIVERAGWQQVFVRRAYVKGVSHADVQLRTAGADVAPRFDDVQRTLQLPIHADALELLYSRNLEELRGVTEAASQEMRRTLADGFAEGWNPRKTATSINRRVDAVGIRRSRLIARTETIRSHSEATLNRFAQHGVTKVTGQAEFATAGDDRVCPICVGLEGQVFDLEEARGVIPVHPNCRCAWLPVTRESQRRASNLRRADPDWWREHSRAHFPDWYRRAA